MIYTSPNISLEPNKSKVKRDISKVSQTTCKIFKEIAFCRINQGDQAVTKEISGNIFTLCSGHCYTKVHRKVTKFFVFEILENCIYFSCRCIHRGGLKCELTIRWIGTYLIIYKVIKNWHIFFICRLSNTISIQPKLQPKLISVHYWKLHPNWLSHCRC